MLHSTMEDRINIIDQKHLIQDTSWKVCPYQRYFHEYALRKARGENQDGPDTLNQTNGTHVQSRQTVQIASDSSKDDPGASFSQNNSLQSECSSSSLKSLPNSASTKTSPQHHDTPFPFPSKAADVPWSKASNTSTDFHTSPTNFSSRPSHPLTQQRHSHLSTISVVSNSSLEFEDDDYSANLDHPFIYMQGTVCNSSSSVNIQSPASSIVPKHIFYDKYDEKLDQGDIHSQSPTPSPDKTLLLQSVDTSISSQTDDNQTNVVNNSEPYILFEEPEEMTPEFDDRGRPTLTILTKFLGGF